MTDALLLVESLHDLLPESGQLDFLLVLQLGEQVADLVIAHLRPLLALSSLGILDLPLDLVSLDVLLSTG